MGAHCHRSWCREALLSTFQECRKTVVEHRMLQNTHVADGVESTVKILWNISFWRHTVLVGRLTLGYLSLHTYGAQAMQWPITWQGESATLIQTLPEAQRTQCIDSLTWVISWAIKKNATCIGSKFGHQVAPHASVTNLATRLHHLH